MTKVTNEYYELIDDKDLNSNRACDRMILVCNNCGALFCMKACGNRSLFQWFGYHPTDGNCQVVTDEFRQANMLKVNECDCDDKYLHRVTSKIQLDQILNVEGYTEEEMAGEEIWWGSEQKPTYDDLPDDDESWRKSIFDPN